MGHYSFFDSLVCRRVLVAVFALAATTVSCDESLPPREPPGTYLNGELTVSDEGNNTRIVRGVPANVTGAFRVRIGNLHNEVLQDTIGSLVTLEIWWKEHPEVASTIKLGASDLANGGLLKGRVLTLPTDSAAIFIHQWSHKTDDGTPFWNYLFSNPVNPPYPQEPYCQTERMTIVVRGTAQLFHSTGPLYFSEQEFHLAYAVYGESCRPLL